MVLWDGGVAINLAIHFLAPLSDLLRLELREDGNRIEGALFPHASTTKGGGGDL